MKVMRKCWAEGEVVEMESTFQKYSVTLRPKSFLIRPFSLGSLMNV